MSSAALPPLRVAHRVEAARAALEAAELPALLVTHPVSRRWLTGFTGSAGLVLLTADDLVLVTDGRYAEQAPAQLGAAGAGGRVEITGTAQRDVVAGALGGVRRLGLEADHVTWAAQRRYAEEWFPAVDLVPTEGLVARLRQRKDEAEVARIRAAAAAVDAALAEVRHLLAEGPTEREVALELDAAIRRHGASGNSFETILASGPNSARPHARPTHRRIEEGDLVVVDVGGVVDGYCSDMTRTYVVGEPSAAQARMWQVVAEAQAAGVAAVAHGVPCAAVDAAARNVIARAGWADAFVHGTGHGVGLEIHEDPRVSPTSAATLAAGAVVTVEPGVYLPDHGGVRIEDTVLVTPEGCEPLTLTPKSTGA